MPEISYAIDALIAAASEGVGERTSSYAYDYRNNTSGGWKRTSFSAHNGGIPTTREEAADMLRQMLDRWVDGTEFRLVEITEAVIGFYTTKVPTA